VVFTWQAPFDNHEAILEYDIIFLSETGDYAQEEALCDGQDPAVTTCIIPMPRVIEIT
jgi:hypothetical protein